LEKQAGRIVIGSIVFSRQSLFHPISRIYIDFPLDVETLYDPVALCAGSFFWGIASPTRKKTYFDLGIEIGLFGSMASYAGWEGRKSQQPWICY